jgi:ubiquinone/menaquinone biosynthesis C-methylase UbiE
MTTDSGGTPYGGLGGEEDRETSRVRRLYDDVAPRYDWFIAPVDRLLFTGGRQWAARQAVGSTLEIAVGTGRNLPFYDAAIRLTGVDISPGMLAVAQSSADALGRQIELRTADAQSLPFPDGTFDAVVSTLALCTIPDAGRAVAEAARVLRPGGRFVAVEHVASPRRIVRAGQRAVDPIFVRLQGDHLLREPHVAAREAGLEVTYQRRSRLGLVQRLVAVKPPAPARG